MPCPPPPGAEPSPRIPDLPLTPLRAVASGRAGAALGKPANNEEKPLNPDLVFLVEAQGCGTKARVEISKWHQAAEPGELGESSRKRAANEVSAAERADAAGSRSPRARRRGIAASEGTSKVIQFQRPAAGRAAAHQIRAPRALFSAVRAHRAARRAERGRLGER